MKDYTIAEEFTLPSLGKIYKKQFNPVVKLRSMTVAEEMKRLSPTETPYKVMSEIIEDCLVEKLPIHVYDLCLGDYIFLLHKLRVVTYGPEYKIKFKCSKCGEITTETVNLDEIGISKYDDSVKNFMTLTLPKTEKVVKLKFQTPRDLDKIAVKAKEMKEEFPEMQGDPTILLTLGSLIESIDEKEVDIVMMMNSFKELPMADMNVISQAATKLNEKVGVDSNITVHCDKCNTDVKIPFRFTNEFFGPTVY